MCTSICLCLCWSFCPASCLSGLSVCLPFCLSGFPSVCMFFRLLSVSFFDGSLVSSYHYVAQCNSHSISICCACLPAHSQARFATTSADHKCQWLSHHLWGFCSVTIPSSSSSSSSVFLGSNSNWLIAAELKSCERSWHYSCLWVFLRHIIPRSDRTTHTHSLQIRSLLEASASKMLVCVCLHKQEVCVCRSASEPVRCMSCNKLSLAVPAVPFWQDWQRISEQPMNHQLWVTITWSRVRRGSVREW